MTLPRRYAPPSRSRADTGRVLLRVGDPIPKWTTGAGIPLPGLFVRANDRAQKMLEGCK